MRFITVVIITMMSILPIVIMSNPIWSDVQVNENRGPRNQRDQISCSNSKGMHVIAWVENRRDSSNGLYIRFFGSDNTPLGPETYVDSYVNKPVSIAINDSGYSIIGWSDWDNRLYTRVIKPNGTYESAKFTLSPSWQEPPRAAVSVDNQKNWICVYTILSTTELDIACWSNTHQKFSTKAINNSDSYKYDLQIVMNDTGNALIMYRIKYPQNIIVQSYTLTSFFKTGEFSSLDVGKTQTFLSDVDQFGLTGFLNGQCAVVWLNGLISPKIVTTDFFQIDQPFKRISSAIDTILSGVSLDNQSIAIDTLNNSIINWERYSENGSACTTHTIFANNSIGLVNRLQRIQSNRATNYISSLVYSAGGFVEYWVDACFSGKDVIGQKYSITGTPFGDVYRVATNEGYSLVRDHQILPFPDGKHLVTWVNSSSGYEDIYGQFYDASGQPIGANILISDDISQYQLGTLQSAHSPNGAALIVWSDRRNTTDAWQDQIYAQFFIGNSKKGTNFRIDPDTNAYGMQSVPMVYAMTNGKFLVLWHAFNILENYVELHSRIVNEDGIPEKTGKISLSNKSTRLYIVNAFIDSLGKSTIVWADSNGINHIQLDSNLNTITQPQTVVPLKPDMQYEYPSLVNVPDHGLLMTWRDKIYASYIYARWFTYSGTPVSDESLIMVDSLNTRVFFDPRMMIMPDGEMVLIWKQFDESSLPKYNYHIQRFTRDMKKIGSSKVMPINFHDVNIQMMGNRVWIAWTQDRYTLMRNAWSIDELLPVVQRNTTIHQATNVSNFHIKENGTNLRLQFNANTLGTGQVNIVQLDGTVIYREPVTISKRGSQLVNITLNRKHLPFGTYVLQFQIAGRNYINKFLNVK